MPLSRRSLLTGAAAALGASRATDARSDSDGALNAIRLGIAQASYAIRSRTDDKLRDPLGFLEFCRQRGAAGVQLPIPIRDAAYSAMLRAAVESSGMFLEGSLRTPRDKTEVDGFEAGVRTARESGALIVRTVLLSGRRYETFASAEEFRRFSEQSRQSLELAAPVLARHKVRLAVENHKDYRADELAELIRRLGSDYVGVCIDTGNNIALLEDPLATVETLAPLAVCVHLKDMAVQEHEEGFLLSEVPLGEGILDLKRIIEVLRKARPGVTFSLEMLTRDPLKIPCLTPKYWATFPNLPGHHLAQTLRLVRLKRRDGLLPQTSGVPPAEQLDAEDKNVRKSLAYAAAELRI